MSANDLFARGLASLNLSLEDLQIDQLCRYLSELHKWNKSINLVAKAEEDVIIETHFLDSLTLAPLVEHCPSPGLIDVGSGAGFPGLVLKIAWPELLITLLEPRQKRASFLRQVIRVLDLHGIRVLATRFDKGNEQLNEWRGAAPMITSRAFTSIGKFLDLAAPFSAPSGKVVCMKGPRADGELKEWQSKYPDSPFSVTEKIKIALPFSETRRELLVFTKNQP